jgi:hypothetical protein
MKINKLPHLAVVLFTPLLCQCVIEEPSTANNNSNYNSYGPSSGSGMSGNAMQSNQVYDLGLERGFSDGRSGQSRTWTRHNGSYPTPEASNFKRGYDIGYNKGSAAQIQ